MFSNKTDLAETNCFTLDYSAIKTECFLQSICLPKTGLSNNNLVEIAPATSPTFQLAGLTDFTEGNIGSEADTSLFINGDAENAEIISYLGVLRASSALSAVMKKIKNQIHSKSTVLPFRDRIRHRIRTILRTS
jgi:hypothetical protein